MHRSSKSPNEAVSCVATASVYSAFYATGRMSSRLAEGLSRNEGNAMRIFMAFAITMAAAIGVGGCFWHHQAAVVTQPAPPLK
jgi:serine acetyltransferase